MKSLVLIEYIYSLTLKSIKRDHLINNVSHLHGEKYDLFETQGHIYWIENNDLIRFNY